MDTNKKILIGAIGAAVVIGGIAIGLLLSKTPEKADLSTIHTEAATKLPRKRFPPPHSSGDRGDHRRPGRRCFQCFRFHRDLYIRKGIYPVSCGGPDG